MPELLGTNISHQVIGSIGMPVCVAVKASNAKTGFVGSPVLGRVELLLRKLREQESETFKLFRIQKPIEDFKIVVNGN